MITIDSIRAVGVERQHAERFLPHLVAACARFRVDGRQATAAFLAQAAHESAGFTRLTENLYYTTPERIKAVWPSRFRSVAEAAQYIRSPERLANRVYAGRLGNGDESSGDGSKYLGRGLFQLTGRANYMAASDAIGVNYKARPELVALPEHAALTAAWFWSSCGCNAAAAAGDIDRTTRLINGPAMLAAADRRDRYEAALQLLA